MKKLDAAGQHSIVGTDQVKVPGFPSPLLLRPGAGVAREERRTVEELDGGRNGPRSGMSVTSHLRAQWATERRTGKAESEPRQAALRDRIGNSYPTAVSLVIQSNSFRKKEILVRTTSRTALTISTIFALLLPAAANASPTPSLERPQSISQTDAVTTPEERGVEAIEGVGLKLSMMSGDRVTVSDGAAHWFNSSGETVATIELSADGRDSDFSFDPIRQVIAPTRTDSPQVSAGSRMQQMAARKCIPKWIGWAWNITWGGLVCLPLSVGVSGVATPIAGAVTASACEAAGGALTTAYSC